MTPYSNSILVDTNTCPTYGAVAGQRRYDTTARAMALEAGGAMHEVFAALRIWQLGHVQGLKKHALFTGERIFGAERWKEAMKGFDTTDERSSLIQLSFNILHTGGFYDDPSDDIRTITNLELSAILYVDEQLKLKDDWHIHVADRRDPSAFVGIEQVFDVVLTFTDGFAVRYIGTLDALYWNVFREKYYLGENKTASRLEDAWRKSFELAHQVTAYCACSTTICGISVMDAQVIGLKLKPSPRGENYYSFSVTRTADAIMKWADWVRYTVSEIERWRNDWENAPRFTHSCNRYFRPCALIDFCSDSAEGRLEQWEQMVPRELSPSERAVQG